MRDGELPNKTRIILLNRIKIVYKIGLGFFVLVSLMLLSATVSYLSSNGATKQIATTRDAHAPIALKSLEAQANLLRMLSATRGYLALGQTQFIDDYNEAQSAFATNLNELEALIETGVLLRQDEGRVASRESLEALREAYGDWVLLPDDLFDIRDDQLEREPAYEILATDGTNLAGAVLIDTQTLITLEAEKAKAGLETDAQSVAKDIQLLRDLSEFQASFAAMFSGLRNYVSTRNRLYYSEYSSNQALNELLWQEIVKSDDDLTKEQADLLVNIGEARAAFLLLPDEQLVPILESDRWRLDLFLFQTEGLPLAEEMLTLLGEITGVEQQALRNELARSASGLLLARQQSLLAGIAAATLGVLLSLVLGANIVGQIVRLTRVAEQIKAGDLEAQVRVESRDELGMLASAFNEMTTRLGETLSQVKREKKRANDLLNVVIPIGVQLTSEQDFNHLLEKILLEAKAYCHADGGSLYLREGDVLKFVMVSTDSQNLLLGGTSGNKIPYAPLQLFDESGNPSHYSIAAEAAVTGEVININNAYTSERYHHFPGPREFDAITGYHTHSMLMIPLKNSGGDVLGVLQLLNAQDPGTGEVIAFDSVLQQMMESFSSLAAAALEAYIREQRLREEIQQLRIEINQTKVRETVRETVETDFFQDLQSRAQDIRKQRRQRRRKKSETVLTAVPEAESEV